MAHNPAHDRLAEADHASRCATARLWGMKYRSAIQPASAAVGGFPYEARTCADWELQPEPMAKRRAERRRADAITGSEQLCAAIRAIAA